MLNKIFNPENGFFKFIGIMNDVFAFSGDGGGAGAGDYRPV